MKGWQQKHIDALQPGTTGKVPEQTLFPGMVSAKERNRKESELQIKVVKDFRALFPEYAKCLFSIPNAGIRNKANGGRMKAEGMLAGASDLFLAVPSGEYHGLFLEAKWGDGRLSDNQKEFLSAMAAQGYNTGVFWTEHQFWEIVQSYLKTNRITP